MNSIDKKLLKILVMFAGKQNGALSKSASEKLLKKIEECPELPRSVTPQEAIDFLDANFRANTSYKRMMRKYEDEANNQEEDGKGK